MGQTADVVVIGGGINGCSIAWHLARRGAGRIVLLEKRHVASGPTGLSSGVVRQHYTNPTLSAMARDSVRFFHAFDEEVGGDAGFVPCGVVFLSGPDTASQVAFTVEMHQGLGIRETLLSPAEVKSMEPQIAASDIACAAYDPEGGYADPALAANSFADAARRLGVDIRRNTAAARLEIAHGTMTGVTTDHDVIGTRAVVIAAGPWGPGLARMAGLDIPLTVTRHPVVVLHRPPGWRTPTPVWGDLIAGWYYKPDGEGGLMVGSVQDDDRPVDPDNYADGITHEETAAASSAILQRFPIMAEGTARKGWAGVYDVTPDSQPVIDRIDDVGGLFCAFGFSGHGFKIAPAVGRIVSDLVVDGACRAYDVSIFRHDRFSTGDLHGSRYRYSVLG